MFILWLLVIASSPSSPCPTLVRSCDNRSCGYLCTYFDTCYRLSIQRNRIHFYWSGNQYYSDCLQKRCLKIFFRWGFSIPWVLPLTAWAREKRQNYVRFFLTAWDLACMNLSLILDHPTILNLSSLPYLSLILEFPIILIIETWTWTLKILILHPIHIYLWRPYHTNLWSFKLELPTILIFDILSLMELPTILIFDILNLKFLPYLSLIF